MESNPQPILSFRNISKTFPGVQALKDVSFDVYPGEVHCIAGENGAGKSTLIKIIAGVQQQTDGQLFFLEKEEKWSSADEPLTKGIVTIFQELSIIPNLSVAENILFGRELTKGPFVSQKAMNKKAKEYLQTFDLRVNPAEYAGRYSIAVRQLMEITRAISREAKVIIMDEPTSSLSENESEKLLELIKSLKSKGMTIIFVSHRIEELLEIGDRITILRDGQYISTLSGSESTKEKVVEMMVGRSLERYYTKSEHEFGEEILKVENFSGHGFKDVSFSLRKGEILGFAGLIGAGRTEVMESMFGYRPITSGKIYLNGKPLKVKNPFDLIEKGIGLVPEDRKAKGLSLIHSIKSNVGYQNLDIIRNKFNLVSSKKEKNLARRAVKELGIRTSSIEKLVFLLSGGNQQKVVISKLLVRNPKILILDEPTRGIDVGAKAEIYKLMDKLALEGIGIIMVSSDLPEILQMSDRIAVMSEGKLVDILQNGPGVNQETIMHLCTVSLNKKTVPGSTV